MKIPLTIRRLYHLRNGRKINSCVSHQKRNQKERPRLFLLKARNSPIANEANEVACSDGNEYPFLKDFQLEPDNHNKLNSDQRKI